ncbi:hypothetical protein JXA12_05625 [Candidatus Woesearchaeota archaeon]|nr:hypothetical protein [Candidatus Woesearchaeota archaeon]
MYDTYRPLEEDSSLSAQERMQKMQEWWSTHDELMIRSGMSKGVLKRILDDHQGILKEGADEFLRMLHDHGVPLLIFSSGLGDLIKGFLKKRSGPLSQYARHRQLLCLRR